MKNILALLASIALAWSGLADAHGPSRQKVSESIEISASPDAVWAIVKDFANPTWMPQVASTAAKGGNDAGATRELTLKAGGVIKEELKKVDEEKKSLQYKITDVEPEVLPVANYAATILVEAAGGGTKVEWNGAFYRSFMNNNPPPEQSDEAAVKAVSGIYKDALANLKAIAEKK